jgi:hypothetical protein
MYDAGVRNRSRLALAAVVIGAAATALALACALPDTHYGAPSDLAASKLPGTDTLACDAGALTSDGNAGDGGDAGDGGTSCAVSWRADLYPKMTTAWGCTTSACHGADAAAPFIDGADASAALGDLEAWQLSTHPGVPYVGKTGDFTKSTIDCNLGGFCTPTMPVLPARQLSGDERCMLRAWLTCGAPDN